MSVRVGVVGAGWWATEVHIPSLLGHPGAEVTAVADTDPMRLARAADAFDISRRFSSAEELVASGSVDALVVATPHALHYTHARTAIEAGLHVLVEKPLTLRAREARDLVARARERSLHLVAGYTHQFTAHAAAARKFVQDGRLGELRLVSGLYASMVESLLRGSPEDYRGALPFKVAAPQPGTYADPSLSGGGQGQTQMTHPVAMLLWVTGARPEAVSAFMAGFGLPIDIVDAVAFRLSGGATGTMAATGTIGRGGGSHLALHYFGSEGHVAHDLGAGTLELWSNNGQHLALPSLAPADRHPAGAPARCLVDLAAGVMDPAHNPAPGEPAARAVELVEAAYQSAARGGALVEL